jgi:sugar lactone lactonase YvrE
MKKGILVLAIIVAFASLGCKKYATLDLVEKWATDRELKVPESVLYDPLRHVLYVSNINGKPLDRDGNGFLSRLSLDGIIEKLIWITGFDAPKGMALDNDTLYVTDIDRFHEVNIARARIVKTRAVEGAQFLNDIAMDQSGVVYVSDMKANRLYVFTGGAITPWLDFDGYTGINGMLFFEGSLYVGSDQGLLAVLPETKEVSLAIPLSGGIDGLKTLSDGRFIVSDWKGKIQVIAPDREPVVLQDTSDMKINAADMEYIAEKKLLLVPTFFDNRVVAYGL